VTVAELKKERRKIRATLAEQIRAIDTQIAVISQQNRRMIPNHAEVIAKVRRWLGMNSSLQDIASELNRRGIKSPEGKRWRAYSLQIWLKLNEVNQ